MRIPTRPTLLSLLSILLVSSHTARTVLAKPIALAAANPQACPVACGNMCCTIQQYCMYDGQCGDNANGGVVNIGAGGSTWSSVFVTTDTNIKTVTKIYSAVPTWTPPPVPTILDPSASGYSSGGGFAYSTYSVATTPGIPTGTNTFLFPVPTATDGSTDFGLGGVIGVDSPPQGLSSGQIGGIVGGILGAFFLIALILICCCLRRGFDGFFGWMNTIGHSRRETVHHSGSGHGHGAAAAATGGILGYMFGKRRGAAETHRTATYHHASSGHGSGHGVARKTGIAALLGGAAAGLTSMFASRRSRHDKYTSESSGYYTTGEETTTSYTSTDYTSESSSSNSSSSSSSG